MPIVTDRSQLGRDGNVKIRASVFDQDAAWIDRTGVYHPLATLDPVYASNLCGYLLRNAARFHHGYGWYLATIPGPNGDIASMQWDSALDEIWGMDPLVWMKETQLYRAVRRRAHGFMVDAGPPHRQVRVRRPVSPPRAPRIITRRHRADRN